MQNQKDVERRRELRQSERASGIKVVRKRLQQSPNNNNKKFTDLRPHDVHLLASNVSELCHGHTLPSSSNSTTVPAGLQTGYQSCDVMVHDEPDASSESDSSESGCEHYDLGQSDSPSDDGSESVPHTQQQRHTPEHLTNITVTEPEVSGDISNEETIRIRLRNWAVKHNVVRQGVDELLSLMRDAGLRFLPKTAKTLLETPKKNSLLIRTLAGGSYFYRGILQGIQSRISEQYIQLHADNSTITVDLFCDGISPHKGVRRHLWVISCCLKSDNQPFVVAMWCGSLHEPSDVNEFLKDLVEEARFLIDNGVELNGTKYSFRIRWFHADAPARAWLRKVNKHGSYYSCERCTVKGIWFGRRVTYLPGTSELRTEESFRLQLQPAHHLGVSSLLIDLNMNMIDQFPLDGMHLIYLGVVKRFVGMLLKSKGSKQKLNDTVIDSLSEMCVSLRSHFPSDFERKPRSLKDWKLFKAVDYRRLLFYDGIVVFHNLSKEVYSCFLLLSCAMRILVDDKLRQQCSHDAHVLLTEFVRFSGKVFGKTFIVYNVHHLEHFTAECVKHGNPEEFSCFKYENSFRGLKAILRAPGRELIQYLNRSDEKNSALNNKFCDSNSTSLGGPHHLGPSLNMPGQQFSKVSVKNFMLQLHGPDSYCLMKNGDCVQIVNFLRDNENVTVIGKAFQQKRDYFLYPVKSSIFNIFVVSQPGNFSHWNLNDIERKIVLLPTSEGFVCIPMLHS